MSTTQPYLDETDAWHARRLENLTAEDGWLSLAGLYWLNEGTNTFGGANDNAIVFPNCAVGRIGAFERDGARVVMTVLDGAGVSVNGRPVAGRATLQAEDDSAPTLVSFGSLNWHLIARGGRIGVRLRDRASPARRRFEGIERFPVDPAWRLDARVERAAETGTMAVPTILGTIDPMPCAGAIVFSHDGVTHRLRAIGAPDDVRWFIVFADATTGRETYGGGRFIYVDVPPAATETVIDFNRAITPPCAFTPYATCPRPPEGNRLPMAITAGEMHATIHDE